MQLPPTDPDTVFEDLVQDLPPETIAMAYAFKAFARARKIKTPQQLLRVVLLYCGRDQSLREVAGTMTLLGSRLTASAMAERLAAWRPWMKALLPQMLASRVHVPLLPGRRFRVIDGSTVPAPGATGLHDRRPLGLDLVTLAGTPLHLSEAKTGESLRLCALGPADIAVADQGSCHPPAVAETIHAGAQVVVRLHPATMPLCQPDETPLDVVQRLQEQAPCPVRSLPVRGGPPTQRVAGWGHAYRRSDEHANKARAIWRQRHSTKGHRPQARPRFLAGWGLVGTSRPPEVLSADTVLALSRVRGPVDLASTRCKSLLDLEALRARYGSPWADLWRHGTLLEALVVDKRLRDIMGEPWGHLDRERTATWWRPWKGMQQTLLPRLTGAVAWPEQDGSASVAVLAERPRHRPLQRLPEARWAAPSQSAPALTPLGAERWEDDIAAYIQHGHLLTWRLCPVW